MHRTEYEKRIYNLSCVWRVAKPPESFEWYRAEALRSNTAKT